MAASIASMAQRKRKLADLSVEEFMSGEFDSDSDSWEKPSSRKKDKKKKGLVTGHKKGLVTGHKRSLQKLKDSDPEFYQFLQDQEKSLLDFDASDEDEEEENDGDVEDEVISKSDGEDKGSDGGEDEKKDKNSKNKEEDDDVDFDMSSDDEDGNIHQPPDELEVMSGSSDEGEDSKGEGKEKQKGKSHSRLVTMAMIKDWTQRFKDSISPSLIHEVTSALKAAVQHVSGETGTTKYKVEGSKAFNAIIRLCLIEIAPALQKMLDLPPLKDLQKPSLPKPKNKKWIKVHIDIKNYLTSILQLMTHLSDASMVNVILKHIHRMVGYYACFPKLTKLMMKKVIVVWSTGEETSRVLAFLCINRLVHVKQEELLETCIKQMYMAYVKNCKFTSPNTLPMINFMQRTLVELFAINFALTYEYAFIYIRQLAIHLRNAITLKKKESVQAVYNWQYIHCIGLWVRVQTTLYPNDILEPLIYPLTQIIIGTIKLVPTARYYPLRFHCVRALNVITSSTNSFIPVLPFLLEVFEQTDFNKKHKSISFKPLNFACILKLSKSQLQEKAFKDGVIDQLYELLLEHFHIHSHTIGFPELALAAVLQLKDFVKKCKVANYCKQMKQILEKVEENSNFITKKRKSATIALSDKNAVIAWERKYQEEGTPLMKFYQSWRKLRDRELQFSISQKDQIVDADQLPEIKRPKGPGKATEAEKKEFSAIFDSNSEDSEDDATRFLPKKERLKKNKEKSMSKRESDDSDDYSDFDSGELEQLARSGDEDEEEEEEENEEPVSEKADDSDDFQDKGDIVKDFTMSSDEEDQENTK
ncbi:hypothetical protein CHS0354_037340 [Potamilus streckersoni]|uniref:Nucleolar complex protein 2 homolog n=1 Tax=Potamilus streckersoni TaxID=2493646 RepID=A0AAE0RM70_9BIVA|nr:hypothetical protein CHS0354_037340 [Potamilus streckersoni]